MDTAGTPRRKAVAGSAAARKAPARRKANRAGRPTAAELERRKLKVMEVATDLFVGQGYAATTLFDIAKLAGVATRTLYQHFGDKEAIFREVIFARDNAIVTPPSAAPGEDLVTVLTRLATYANDVALRPRSIDLMRLMIAESARFPDLMGKVAKATFARFKANVARVFRQLAESGAIPQGDHDESADLFADLVLGNQTTMVYFGWASGPPSAEDIDRKVRLFIRGRFGIDAPAAKA